MNNLEQTQASSSLDSSSELIIVPTINTARHSKKNSQSNSQQPLSPKSLLRNTHPQQNTFTFDNKVVFSSTFDSGNMSRCIQANKNYFHIYISEDSLPYTTAGHYRTWFYFSVTGVNKGETLTFSIRNMNNQGKLYKSGLKPVYRVLPTHQKKWKRIPNEVGYDYGSEGFYITYSFQFNHEPTEVCYFAFTYPFSYEESMKKSEKLEEKYKNHESIYFHREILANSIEQRPMEMITFTGMDKITQQREDLIDNLFPEHEKDQSKRPFKFDKPTIFLTSRVHPGETPASFVLNGIINFLTNEKSEQAKILLQNFVFKIIPMLNPDGVYRGYYRLDTKNQNLNRYYIDPTQELQPTIYAAKQAILQQHQYKKLFVYVDLHAHASKKGCFMFGNHLYGEQQLQNMLLPKLVSMNSLNFDFVECSFSEKMMNVKDKKDGLSREGCGRVSIYKSTDLPHCYTLECNYASGRRLNHLSAKLNKQTGEVEPELPITDIHSKTYQETKTPPYTIEIFEDVGRAFCIGLLDYIEKNPISRIPMSNLKTLENVKNDLIAHHNILIPKKRPDQLQNEKKGSNQQINRSNTGKRSTSQNPMQTSNQKSNNLIKSAGPIKKQTSCVNSDKQSIQKLIESTKDSSSVLSKEQQSQNSTAEKNQVKVQKYLEGEIICEKAEYTEFQEEEIIETNQDENDESDEDAQKINDDPEELAKRNLLDQEEKEYFKMDMLSSSNKPKSSNQQHRNASVVGKLSTTTSVRQTTDKIVRNVTEKRKQIDQTLSERRGILRQQSVNVHQVKNQNILKQSHDVGTGSCNSNNQDELETASSQSKQRDLVVYQSEVISSSSTAAKGQENTQIRTYQKNTKTFQYQINRQSHSRGGQNRHMKDQSLSQNYPSQQKAVAPITNFRMPTPPDQSSFMKINDQSTLLQSRPTYMHKGKVIDNEFYSQMKLPDITPTQGLIGNKLIPQKNGLVLERQPLFKQTQDGARLLKEQRQRIQSEGAVNRFYSQKHSQVSGTSGIVNVNAKRMSSKNSLISPKFVNDQLLCRIVRNSQVRIEHNQSPAAAE